MKKGTIFVSLLLLLLSIVRAQDGAPTAGTPTPTASPAPNGIETCLEISQCGDDQACRAKCAGVPNPTEQQVNDTIACIGKCNPGQYFTEFFFLKKRWDNNICLILSFL